MATWLTLAGIVIQCLGAAVVVIPGSRSLWHEALNPVRKFIEQTRRLMVGFLRRLIRKAPPPVAHGRSVTDTASPTDSVRAGISYAPMADHLSDAEKIAILDRRTQAINTDLGHLANQTSERIDAQDRRLNDLEGEFRAYAGEQAVQDRKQAIRQLQWQAVGLIFVAFGSLLQAWGSLLSLDHIPGSTGPAVSESHANDLAHGHRRSPVAGQATGGLYHPGPPAAAIVAAIPN